MQPQAIEGKWEDIVSRNGVELTGRKVKVYVETETAVLDAPLPVPNEQALAMLRDLVKLQEGMKETDGSETDGLLREARSGGMYGFKPTE